MSDGPADGGRTARSDAATRLADLLADVVEDAAPASTPAPPPEGPARPPARRIVRRRPSATPDGDADASPGPPVDPDATQPIAVVDLDGPSPAPSSAGPAAPPPAEVDADTTVEVEPPAPPTVTKAAARSTPAAPAPAGWGPSPSTAPPRPDTARPDTARPATDPPTSPPDTGSPPPSPGRRAPRLTLRALAFGVAFALLAAAVPALGWVGVERIRDSRGGDVRESSTTDATAPGFTALVDPTPTAMVIHRDADRRPVSVTILALGAGDEGGTVLLVPVNLGLVEPDFFDRAIDRWDSTQDDDAFRRDIEDVIGVSVPPPLIDVTDESLATLVSPVAPLNVTVNDPVVDEDGVPYEGNVSLSAEQVGPYLRASRAGEPEIAHMERARDVWVAWLEAIGSATSTEPIGAAATGIGSFLRILAAGDPVVETLDVVEGPVTRAFVLPAYLPGDGMEDQVADAIPFPRSPRTGVRYDLRLLNGVEGATPPMSLMHDLALDRAAISTVGNAARFGRDTTLVEYTDDEWEDEMDLLRERWGDSIEVEQMSASRAEATNEDVVITLGRDVLDQYQE